MSRTVTRVPCPACRHWCEYASDGVWEVTCPCWDKPFTDRLRLGAAMIAAATRKENA